MRLPALRPCRRQRWRCIALALASILPAVPAAAEGSVQRRWTDLAFPPSFDHVSVEQGLSQSSVHSIVQDRRGFLWFGTDAGLNRYDGFHFRTFHPKEGDAQSLSGDWIERIMEDRHGFLWLATRNAGITLLDTDTLAMFPIPVSGRSGGLPAKTVNDMVEDRQGNIWIATESDGLYRVAPEWTPPALPAFEKLDALPSDPQGAPERRVSALFLDSKGALWIGTREKGLGRLRSTRATSTFSFDYFAHDPTHPDTSAPEMINVIQEDPFGRIWLGSDIGLFIFDPVSSKFERWTSNEFRMGHGRVLSILRDKRDTLWVASDGLGLFKALPQQHRNDPVRFTQFTHDPKDVGSLSRNGLQCVFEDNAGVLWVSAYQGGLNKLVLNPSAGTHRERPSLFQYRNNAADPLSLSGDTVATMGEDRFGNLWIGTDGFGLNRVTVPKNQGDRARFERFREDPAHGPGALQTDVILTTHLDAQKQLWFGSFNGGLIRVDQASASAQPRFTHFRHDPNDPSSLASDFVRDILDDGSGGFWVAFDAGFGLDHFDPRTGIAKHYKPGDGRRSLNNGNLLRMASDSFGTIWIASQLGLHRFNPTTEEFRFYLPGGEHSLSDTFINTLYLDPLGILWIGTKSGGLNRMQVPPWDGPAPRFVAYRTAEGLPSNTVIGILPDRMGNLWLSTPRSLCRFNIAEGRAHPLNWQRELRRAEFIWNAAFLGSEGEMLFGSNDGLTLFHPDDLVANPIPPSIAITDFWVLNKSLPLKARMPARTSGQVAPGITLAPSDSTFSLEFAAMHFAAPEQNQYAYRMEGLDQGWNEIGNKHVVSYSTLPPGDYVLRIIASNGDGVWSPKEFKLPIHIMRPWHRTWWFRLVILAFSLVVVYVIIRVRLRVVTYRNRVLRGLVAARTQELAAANEALQNQSLTDPLTGLRNRRVLDTCMSELVAMARRQPRAISHGGVDRMKLNIDVFFIMLDIDHFKAVNDIHGHLAGDLVLQQFGEILRRVTRTSDTVTRWGGEEFLVVARNAARADATNPPERIRSAVEAHAFVIGEGKTIRCTCSLGFSVFPLLPGETEMFSWEQVVAIADACLYAAKRHGRNAWVGIVPDFGSLAESAKCAIPTTVPELVKSGLLPVLTSVKGPIKW